jgi:hypothetical protein
MTELGGRVQEDSEEIPPEAEHERAGKNSTGRSGRKKIGTERTRAQR